METEPRVAGDLIVHEVRVDTHSLTAFGKFMRRELDENIAPMASRVGPTLASGTMVGTRIPSADIEQ